ncbi:PREDICTED: 60S ribosomal protein L12-like [Colobus angolensis palliatus]|uniref:60S ribosomal protein L12-like n=1 Tax=Colobus angolensis palliatus TaxID=336983 RepID=UPI0005F4CA98|nr:PREDICTED: 60S ribosomal protein L12-like [Colobus angolensis palliatus]
MRPKCDPNEIKVVYLRCTVGEVSAMSALAPKIGPLGLQAQIEVVPSASTLIIKALKEPPRDRKKQENIQHSGNVTFDEIINIPRQMQHQSLARELTGTIKEILGTAQSVGCHVDGCHPHGIIDDINSGAVECPACDESPPQRGLPRELLWRCHLPKACSVTGSQARGSWLQWLVAAGHQPSLKIQKPNQTSFSQQNQTASDTASFSPKKQTSWIQVWQDHLLWRKASGPPVGVSSPTQDEN